MINERKEYSSNWRDYKFPEDEVVGTFTMVMNVSKSDIESVITGSFEGGSNYWMGIKSSDKVWQAKPNGIPYSTWATQMIIEGETIPLYDQENDGVMLLLTLDKLINGISLNTLNRPWDSEFKDGKGDAITCDCIIQFAVFDEVVYG